MEVTSSQITMAEVKGTSTTDYVRALVSQYFWTWYEDNQDDVITHVSLFGGLIRYKITVKMLRPLFVKLFGNP
jgi:hypothetical protein